MGPVYSPSHSHLQPRCFSAGASHRPQTWAMAARAVASRHVPRLTTCVRSLRLSDSFPAATRHAAAKDSLGLVCCSSLSFI